VLALLAGAGATSCGRSPPAAPGPAFTALPAISTAGDGALPVYNERHVIARLIDAACLLDWPWDRLEVQVLDDSTDATRETARQRSPPAPGGSRSSTSRANRA
jgi:hypothetical protein